MIPYITNQQIKNLNIPDTTAIEWVKQAFLLKERAYLPHKTSISYDGDKFFNIMPTIIPELDIMGIKAVSRYPERTPTIDGHILCYNYKNGNLTHMLDAAHITATRTGAVCALAVNTLAISDFNTISLIGLGDVGYSVMKHLIAFYPDRNMHIKLFKYKDHAEKFCSYFNKHKTLTFSIHQSMQDFISDSDVVISCITNATETLAQPEWFKPGVLLVPVHTKGFQPCDLVFDKVFADDTEHVSGFRYFSQFKQFAELSDVLRGTIKGRENNQERIISYNIGIALHDIVFAKHIIEQIG